MKSKDQILLESIYSKKVLKEELESMNGEQSKIKLIAMDGSLYTPFDVASDELKNYWGDDDIAREGLTLADRDETGDVITTRWPDGFDPIDLAKLLYGARETGQIPSDTTSVLLPDGTEFEIDAHGV
jgi:hypothetical protein